MHLSTLASRPMPVVEPAPTVRGAVRTAELVPRLAMIAKHMRALVNIALGELDLVAGQDQMILVLDRDRPLVVSELADALAVRASTVSKMICILERKGLVARSTHEGDARKVEIVLTDAGVEMRRRVEDIFKTMENQIGNAVGEDRNAIFGTLDRLDRCLTTRLRRLR